MKSSAQNADKKTAGTIAVEKHRPVMNKLSDAARRRLRQRAGELLWIG